MNQRQCFVYILASKRNGTLYIGSTGDLPSRVYQHKNSYVDGFTKKYSVSMLVYYEEASNTYEALNRERQLKKWNRAWKIRLIEEFNPDWKDLFDQICE
jgi:putative endonuclease